MCYHSLGKNSKIKVHHCVIFWSSQINVPLQDLAKNWCEKYPPLTECAPSAQEHDQVFAWVCVSLYVHIFVCCFCLHACVGVEQIHVIRVIDILPLAESWSQRLMEMRFKIRPFFYFCPASLSLTNFCTDWLRLWSITS